MNNSTLIIVIGLSLIGTTLVGIYLELSRTTAKTELPNEITLITKHAPTREFICYREHLVVGEAYSCFPSDKQH